MPAVAFAASLSTSDVARRFGVSADTVRKWKKTGKLFGWTERDGKGRFTLRFDPADVERFRMEWDVRPVRRWSTAEVEKVVGIARDLARGGETSFTWVCRRVAVEVQRPERGVADKIREYERGSGTVVVPRRGRKTAAVAVVAERNLFTCFEVTKAVQVVVTAPVVLPPAPKVVALPCPAPLDHIPSPEFAAADADPKLAADILGPMPGLADFEAKRQSAVVPENAPPEMAHLYLWPLLTREQEAHLFRQMNYLKHRGDAASARSVRDILINCNQRLVYAQAKMRLASSGLDIDELVSDGNVSLMRAVEKFDYSRGFKFSTYATWAIRKNFARSLQDEQKRQQRFPTGHDELFDGRSDGRGDEAERRDDVRASNSRIETLLSTLDPRTREVVMMKHGIGCDELKVEEIGRELGLTKERVRQIANRGTKLLREHAAKKAAGCVLCDAAHKEVVERPG